MSLYETLIAYLDKKAEENLKEKRKLVWGSQQLCSELTYVLHLCTSPTGLEPVRDEYSLQSAGWKQVNQEVTFCYRWKKCRTGKFPNDWMLSTLSYLNTHIQSVRCKIARQRCPDNRARIDRKFYFLSHGFHITAIQQDSYYAYIYITIPLNFQGNSLHP
ncbi:hypothetical protein [Roseburia sp. 499]|uniref:hypothetical protein n=1 Tax=Roseburia sp. 499 TaxID=1261634 RepID=UPI00095299FE|nr:hypothetical protein [Roseburia sp. 499]WVK69389.1 hypothetical protein BIV20_13640 [Roseburia sp. 499]